MKRQALIYVAMLLLTLALPVIEGGAVFTSGPDMVIGEGETVRYSDQILSVNGDLRVRGTLILNNVTLVLNNRDDSLFSVESGGMLRMTDSVLLSSLEYVSWNIDYELPAGMNTLSFPLHRSDDCIKSVLEPLEGYFDKVYYYDRWDTSRPWKSYVVDRPDHFNSLRHVNNTMGVEVNITSPVNISTRGSFHENYRYTLERGWNWISYPLAEPMTMEDFFADIIPDINTVRSAEGGNEYDLTPEQYMLPGRGYKVSAANSTVLSVDVSYGVDRDHHGGEPEFNGLRLTFQEGSSGVVRGSTIRGFHATTGAPDLIIRSPSVTLTDNTFVDNGVAVRVDGTYAVISDSRFESYGTAGVELRNASAVIERNVFTSQVGVAVDSHGCTVDISNNKFSGEHGTIIRDSTGVIFNNDFTQISGHGIQVLGGDMIVDGNTFKDVGRAGVSTLEANMVIKQNTFDMCGGGINFVRGRATITDNQMLGNGYGIQLDHVTDLSTLRGNEFWDTQGWSVRLFDVQNLRVSDNSVEGGSYGMHIHGANITVTDNLITNCDGRGMVISATGEFVASGNTITHNGGVGMDISGAPGLVKDNRITRNNGGFTTSSDIHFYNNTVSNNGHYGINIRGTSNLLIENTTLSGNTNHGIKFEYSNAFVKTSSIIGSRYHLHLTSSYVSTMLSFFDVNMVWVDQNSELCVMDSITITMKEGEVIRGYDILSHLPPGAVITGIRDNGSVSVTADIHGYIHIIPPPYYHGTVNFTLDIRFYDVMTSTIPVTLFIQAVNNPPVLEEVYLNITYNPTRVRWVLRYTDHDNEPPRYVELVVDDNHYTMKELNISDTTFSDGKLYYHEMYLDTGEYEYFYIAQETNPLGPNITVRTDTRTFTVEPPGQNILSNLFVTGLSLIILLLVIILLYTVLVKHRLQDSWDSRVIDTSDDTRGHSPDPLLRDMDKKYVNIHSLPVLKRKGVVSTETIPVLKRKRETSAETIPVLKRKRETSAETIPVLKRKRETSTETIPVLKRKRETSTETIPVPKRKEEVSTETIPVLKRKRETSTETMEWGHEYPENINEELTEEFGVEPVAQEQTENIIDNVGDEFREDGSELVVGGLRKRRLLKEEGRHVVLPKHRVIKGDLKRSSLSRKFRRLKGHNG